VVLGVDGTEEIEGGLGVERELGFGEEWLAWADWEGRIANEECFR